MSASRRDKTSNLVQNGFEWLSLRQRPGFENYGDVNYGKINIHHLWNHSLYMKENERTIIFPSNEYVKNAK